MKEIEEFKHWWEYSEEELKYLPSLPQKKDLYYKNGSKVPIVWNGQFWEYPVID